MRARGYGRRILFMYAGLSAAAGLWPAAVPAQQTPVPPVTQPAPGPAPLLTLDQDRLYAETEFGRRLQAEIDAASQELADRNQRLTEELTAEEKEITEKRKTVTPKEFRELADAFDAKVTRLREEQDALILALQRRRDMERRVFTGRILPILSELVRDRGAVAILDDRAVILSAESIDATDEAIARIDALLGDGAAPEANGAPGTDAAPPAVEAPLPAPNP